MNKTITIDENVWKKLTLLKLKSNNKTISDVINELIKDGEEESAL